jgi:hypothetical protein
MRRQDGTVNECAVHASACQHLPNGIKSCYALVRAANAIGGVVAYLEPYPTREPYPAQGTGQLPRGRKSRRAARQAFLGTWLADSLEPGDRLVASVEGYIRQSRAREIVSGAVVLAGIYPGWLDWASHSGRAVHGLIFLLIAATSICSAVEVLIRKPLYVAVTERQLTLVQMNLSRQPVRVLATVPIGAVSLTTGRRSLSVAAVDGSPLQIDHKARARLKIRVTDRQTRLDAVAAVVAAGGGMVNLPPALGTGTGLLADVPATGRAAGQS